MAVLGCVYTLAGAAEKSFEVLGIGGAGGMFAPAVSPQDPNLMFIACDMGGAYRSTDGGQHWEMLRCKQLSNSLRCRPLFLKDAIVWVSGSTPKISRDKGDSWQPLVAGALPWKGQVIRMAADATDENVLLIGTDGGELWRSADAGKTWKLSRSGRVNAVLGLGSKIYASIDGKFLVSRDKGESWEEIAVPAAQGKGFLSLAGGSGDGATVLYGPVFKVGMLQSSDEGKTWKVVDEFRDCNEVLMASNQTKVAYAAQSGHGGAHSIFRTTDGGKTWESCFRIAHEGGNVERSWVQTELSWGYYISPLGVGISATNPKTMLVSTQGDFYLTRDGGESWKQLMNIPLGVLAGDPGKRFQCNGLEVTSCWEYLFDPFIKDRTYIAYTDIGFARSVDRGKTWSWSAHGCPWSNTFYQVVFDPHVKGKLYAATSNRHDIPHWTHVDKNTPTHAGGVCVSEDGGVTWKVLGTGLPKLPCTSICIDPKGPPGKLTMYTTLFEGGCYKSVDNGQTWVKKSSGLGNPGNLHALRAWVHPKTGDVYCGITAFRDGSKISRSRRPVEINRWRRELDRPDQGPEAPLARRFRDRSPESRRDLPDGRHHPRRRGRRCVWHDRRRKIMEAAAEG